MLNFAGCSTTTSEATSQFIDKQKEKPTSSNLVILTYHNMTESKANIKSGSDIVANDFKKHMEYLHKNNYKTIGIDEFLTYYKQKKFPKKSVMITFDDGYKSFYTMAYPVLQKYDFKAVVFPIVSLTPGLERKLIWNEHLTFNHLRLMNQDSNLIDIGSHSYDLHYYRDDKKTAINRKKDEDMDEYKSRIRKDLRVSRDILELQTDKNIIALAWPYGTTNETAKQIAGELGFKLLFSLKPGTVTPQTPLNDIPRYSIKSGSLDELKKILAKGFSR